MIRWHTGAERVETLAFSPDGQTLASAPFRGQVVQLWRPDGTQAGELRAAAVIRAAAFTPDGRCLAVVSEQPRVRLVDLRSGRAADLLAPALCAAAAFAPDGSRLVALLAGGGVVTWDDPTARRWWGRDRPPDHLHPADRNPSLADAQGLTFAPDGRLVLAGRQAVTVWDVPPARAGRALPHPPATGYRSLVAVSPDGQRVTASFGRGVVVWPPDADTPRTLPGSTDHWSVRGLGFAPDGSLLSAGNEGTARRWDADGAECGVWDFGLGNFQSLAVSPDGLTAAAGARDGHIVVWDL